MKLAGFLLLLSGWFIALAAMAILTKAPVRAGFVLAGLGVEILGLVIAFRAHTHPKEDRA